MQKFRFYLRFSFVRVPSFRSFRGSYECVRIPLYVVVADGFMPRKVLDVRKECVRLSCQRQTKSPSGLSVGGLFAYRHAPERLRSRTPWNKSSAYVLYTHCVVRLSLKRYFQRKCVFRRRSTPLNQARRRLRLLGLFAAFFRPPFFEIDFITRTRKIFVTSRK